MMSYRDTTFCVSAEHLRACTQRLTPEVEAAAERWWVAGGGKPGGAPIAAADLCGQAMADLIRRLIPEDEEERWSSTPS